MRRTPLTTALLYAAIGLLFGVGILHGLPGSDGWDNDGVAPRDFIPGLVETFTPGHYFTYPPLHLALLAVVTLPVSIAVAVRAPSLTVEALMRTALETPFMTAYALVARVVTLAMALGTVAALARIAEEIAGRRAARLAAVAAALDVALVYYAKTSNLDVPYFFWSSLALLALVRAVARAEPRRLRSVALLGVTAIATKDQAYALFAMGVPATVALWLAVDGDARARWRTIARELAVSAAIAVALGAVLDGAVVNPRGFRARLAFLAGPASQDFSNYPRGPRGWAMVTRDMGSALVECAPPAVFVVALGGVVWLLARPAGPRARRVAACAPLFFAVSFTVFFNWMAGRLEHRFVMPQALLSSLYAAVAVDAAWSSARSKPMRALIAAAFATIGAVALFRAVEVDANVVADPRHDAEAFLRANVRPGDAIETYGPNVYLPRFPAGALVTRAGPERSDHNSPMPNMREAVEPFERIDERRPSWIVVAEGWAWRYLDATPSTVTAAQAAPTVARLRSDEASVRFFKELFDGDRGYRLVHESRFDAPPFRAVDIHKSTGQRVWIFARVDQRDADDAASRGR